jgi:precorrin-2 dehydrogenase/sirohydrochlorin ferrochelatase/precorrin-6A/cobalt-precorrin-6A reductase
LADHGHQVTLSVASDLGRRAAAGHPGVVIVSEHRGPLGMAEYFAQEGFGRVIDATHPYAAVVTGHILSAAAAAGVDYVRLLRPATAQGPGLRVAESAEAAAALLHGGDSKVLLTIGSKQLEAFTRLLGFAERVYLRILPLPGSLDKALALGFASDHIICMQGPIPEEMNLALLRMCKAKHLVTKDSGDIGGFPDKVAAAHAAGVEVIVIGRPTSEPGLGLTQVLSLFGIGPDAVGPSVGEKPGTDARQAAGGAMPLPLFIDMRGRRALVVGGGRVAERRVRRLLRFGAEVTVISPSLGEWLQTALEQGQLSYIKRAYQAGDVTTGDPFIVIAATSDREANRLVGEEAKALCIPVSVADRRGEGSLYFPALAEGEAYMAGIVSKTGDHAGVRLKALEVGEVL